MCLFFKNVFLSKIETMVDTLKDGFQQYIDQQAAWIQDDRTRTIAKEKVEFLSAAIGYIEFASNDQLLDEYYERVRNETID